MVSKLLLCLFVLFSSCSFAKSLNWKQNPVVYGISPYYFAKDQPVKALKAIRQRLPEIKDLGANVVWLMPITTPSEPGHGYDVINQEQIWPELGNEKDLKDLVSRAHELGIKIILDVVTNHSSAHHPFVKKACLHEDPSHVSEFYQSETFSDIPYARHFNTKQLLECPAREFIYYFWPELLNYNYKSSRLKNYILHVLNRWLEKFDVDGFRFDASWGPSSRWPTFYKFISTALRKTKPDIVLLAEDKAGYPEEYKGTHHPHLAGSSFDWAYDWNNQDTDWISKWSFEIEEETTVFNEEDPVVAADFFLKALSYTKDLTDIKALRYLENNDTEGFLRNHTVEQEKFAARMMFLLPGVPLVFYGQEIGSDHEQWALETFDPERSIKSYNPSLYSFYKELISMRRSSPVLSEGNLENLKRLSPTRVSFDRHLGDRTVHIEADFKTLQITQELSEREAPAQVAQVSE